MKSKVECAIPVLPVNNLEASLGFYTQILGFTIDWGGAKGSKIDSVSRDCANIMLSEMHGEQDPTWVWVGLNDDSLF